MRKIAKNIKNITGLFLGVSIILCIVVGFYQKTLPDNYYLPESGSFNINTFFNINTSVSINADKSIPVYKGEKSESESTTSLKTNADLKLLGIFPIKEVALEKIERPVLTPCGTPFGIKLLTGGAVVAKFGEVDTENGESCPAREGGLRGGDVIIKVNGMDITKNDDISNAVQLNSLVTNIIFMRDGAEQSLDITPVKSKKDNSLKIGLWVRDSSAGIGTMTYYNNKDGTFAGLGHGVCDVDTGQILPLASGEAVSVHISGVVKGYPGAPGELCGTFLSRVPVGTIGKNTASGVFGSMQSPPAIDGGIPMAYKQEVEIGEAKIISTLDGNTPKEYDVLIEKIDYNDRNMIKNMVVKVTDKELLKHSGGIVQGMSGSPIIQNGRLAGAITHVFVNDPTRGYAIFAENMYRESLNNELDESLEGIDTGGADFHTAA